tara:strand:+ start:6094 stop:6312 length:219 start_codon:yes stop_codon:yes gene_type:complete
MGASEASATGNACEARFIGFNAVAYGRGAVLGAVYFLHLVYFAKSGVFCEPQGETGSQLPVLGIFLAFLPRI